MAVTIPAPRPAVPTVVRGDADARQGRRSGLYLSLPFLVLYVLFFLGPLGYGAVMSLFNTSIAHSGLGSARGLGNYAEVLSSADFWSSMWHSVQFTLYTTIPLVVISLLLALLTERVRRGRGFYRFVFFAPYVIPSASVALIFGLVYAAQIGLATTWLTAIGITAPNWLGSTGWAMISMALLTLWWTVGFNYVLYVAALQDIPRDVYDAAAVDGARGWATIRHITVPLLGRTTALVVALQVIASLKVFDQIYLVLVGGPNFSTRPALEYIYESGFTDYRAGYADAASLVYLVVILAVSALWLVAGRIIGRKG
ncbi:carbohydrate ABC transporter permease [Nocardia miyunensis]|uniref:carbohydrate ABC transporter permease n=1 Tax=Nocardia miyunensis TaxID=282684 RepID=UPI000A076435|nr:sugar ABC transporter permease [Nocardia miyunensis]